ncbi:hypothetical protein [Thalassomonas actiniarum]|uniref:Uncharacterized protein n=1 Tax=Thalassomonas actiniarum TaxID=485447 RepID=A0AAE9YWY3_9GAMM|nr:hypothetical protein [Thalassomonas actiniarum]WDE02403.1 hypothetical protein SG35_028745 [Thalassomonas actiniarum]
MGIITYDETDELETDDIQFDKPYSLTGISGFEIAYGSANKAVIKKAVKHKFRVKERLDALQEKRRLKKEIDTLYDEWEH